MRLSHCASLLLAPLAFGLLVAVRPVAAQTLTFEGLKDQEGVGNYYNGGLGSEGSGPGSNYGVTFSSNALALTSSAAGGGGNFSGEPSPSNILFFLGNNSSGTSAATLNDASGFSTGFSFYYASASNATTSSNGFVTVYSGLNETGTVLATLALPDTPTPYSVFVPIGVAFTGTAKSVDFGGAANYIGFDNVTFNSVTPTAVPEPSSVAAFAVGTLGVLGLLLRRKKAAAA